MGARRRDVLAVWLAACGFGCISVLAKLAYEAGAGARSLLAARLAAAAVALAPLALRWSVRSVPRRAVRRGVVGGVAFAAGGFLEFEALARMPAATVVVILFLAPVWVAIGSRIFRGRRIGPRSAAMLGLVLLGVLLLVGPPGGGALDARGVAAAMAASLLYAAVFLVLEDLVADVGPLSAVALVVWAGAGVACLVEPVGAAAELSDPATAPYAATVGVLTAGSLVLLAGGLRTIPAFAASVVTAAEPLAAAAMAWIVLGELLTAVQIAGALAAVCGAVGIARG